MNNKGKISVFLCVLLSALLMLAVTVIKVVDIRNAKVRSTMCLRTAVSSIKATYNNYIFDKYHILLFDKNCSGKGEGYIEERIKNNLEYNLGSLFSVKDVMIENTKGIMENDYKELKTQIDDYMKLTYAKEELGKAFDNILQQDNNSGTVIKPKDMKEVGDETSTSEDISTACITCKDPRDYVKSFMSGSLLYFVAPKDLPMGTDEIDLSKVPSYSVNSYFSDAANIDISFEDEEALYNVLSKESSSINVKDMANAASSFALEIEYARQVFNCATNYKINEESVLDFELEYLIAGGASDVDNLEYVVKRIVLCRLPINFVYLCNSVGKMNAIRTISVPLSIATLTPEPVIRYLIAGAWAYMESVMDVRLLLHGKRIAFTKSDDNWITDMDCFEAIDCTNIPDSKTGLKYEDYLVMLLLAHRDTFYARMLDLMEINAQTKDEKFQIETSVTEIKVALDIDYKGYDCSGCISMGY